MRACLVSSNVISVESFVIVQFWSSHNLSFIVDPMDIGSRNTYNTTHMAVADNINVRIFRHVHRAMKSEE